jgi:UDP-2-acetamido-2,6-beta-L-arabino-hexul-4-ose reductase
LNERVNDVDFVFHLAGVNRPETSEEYVSGNVGFTEKLCGALSQSDKSPPIIFASSIQVERDNEYGNSKRSAEEQLIRFQKQHDFPVYICRLPNVFGKWARPNYNSVVATFCYNVARGKAIRIDDPETVLRLTYIDDLIDFFVGLLKRKEHSGCKIFEEFNEYKVKVGDLASQLYEFADSRHNLTTAAVGSGFLRALFATFLSYFPSENFSYEIPVHSDARGVFVEMLKTSDSGQFSFFTAYPGITRGGHFHHTKTEKFLVIKGDALFRFKHILTGELCEIYVNADKSEIVETIPGWAHDVTNVGDGELIVMLWANEIFDSKKPDTFSLSLSDF